jgi:predicted RNase H-like HicB family nuclease
MKAKFTAVLRREEDEYVALNPELDIASQGPTPELALANLREAVGTLPRGLSRPSKNGFMDCRVYL